MADLCLNSSNTTECLLRAILEANSGYNWNPITFGFTAVFTIIAFIVSLFALFQQFVAAGPGRLKASARAIGSNQSQQRSVTQFSWSEFRFRTTVNVPVIDIKKIMEHEYVAIDMLPNATHHMPIKSRSQNNSITPIERGRVVAGWSQLLNDLSLADVEFDKLQSFTDYLPDDIPAAPAWARMESIVLLSIMKGCTRLVENEDGFINATGPSSQLGWNMHPTLGPMALYQTWELKNTALHLLSQVQTMIPLFLGELRFSGVKLFKPLRQRRLEVPVTFNFTLLKDLSFPSWSRCRHRHDHCFARSRGLWSVYLDSEANREGEVDVQSAALASALFADRPAVAKAYPTRVAKMHSAISTMYEEYFPWLMLADDLNDHVLSQLCGDSFIEFDGRDANTDILSQMSTNLTSWLPAAAAEQTSLGSSNTIIPQRPALRLSDVVHDSKLGLTKDPHPLSEKVAACKLRIARPAVRHLSKWLSDETYFATASFPELDNAKRWLTYQLAELDCFLSQMGDDAICAASNLVALGTVTFGVVQFTKLSRRFVMPETLDAFNLEWAIGPEDEGTIIVKGYLDRKTIQQLFAYTRQYIDMNRKDLHAVKCSKTAQGFFYASNKPYTKKTNVLTSAGPVLTSADTLLGSPSGNANASKPTAEAYSIPIRGDTAESPDSDPASRQTSKTGETVVSPNPTAELPQHFGQDELREWLEREERRGSADGDGREPAVKVDERVSALEALTFFRAAVFAALLASGTDTSLILTSDKRYQLIQVQ